PITSRRCGENSLNRSSMRSGSYTLAGTLQEKGNASSAPRLKTCRLPRLERVLELFHQELVDARRDLLEELLAVGERVLAPRLVPAAAVALGGEHAARAAEALAVRQLVVRLRLAQVERLHLRAVTEVGVLRPQRLALGRPHVEVRPAFAPPLRQLVLGQPLAFDGVRFEPPGREEDVVLDRDRFRRIPLRDLRRAGTGVDAHAGEAAAEEPLHLRQRGEIEPARLVEVRA